MAQLKKNKKTNSNENVNTNEVTEPYPTSMDDYEIFGRIGKGAFASVFIANCKAKNCEVAIKVIELDEKQPDDEENNKNNNDQNNDNNNDNDNNNNNNDISWDEIQKEAAIMTRMLHKNIVCCYASFSVASELWLVMPLLIGSCLDIMKSIAEFNCGFDDEAIISTIIHDVLCGIQYIHHDGRLHRDIKSANILLSANGVCQISDFGVSGAIIEGGLRKNGRHTFTGSLWWMSPEILQRENKHSYSTDIWSIGITALELAFGKPPHSKQRPVKVMLTILQSSPPTMDLYATTSNKKYSKKFKDFLFKCLQHKPNKRASASVLLNHSFIKQRKDNQYLFNAIIAKHELNNNQLHTTNNHIVPNSISQQQTNAKLKIKRCESNGFDFNSEIHSISRSHDSHSDLNANAKAEQPEIKQSEKLGRFDVIVQNKEKEQQKEKVTDDMTDITTKKGRFKITRYNK